MEAGRKHRVGLVGCGYISDVYLRTLAASTNVHVVTCADAVDSVATSCATRHGLDAQSVDELLTDPSLDIVLNLTPPLAHADVSRGALAEGKHVYTEKPLACAFEEGLAITALAGAHGLRVGSAPDTFLGPAWQAVRRELDRGSVGDPVAVEATMFHRGHETWHPNPEFFYLRGGGPMFDMGPYYLTTLVSLLGPVRRVTGSTKRTFAQRPPLPGVRPERRIPVEVATHVAAVLDFVDGTVATLVTSFDVYAERESKLVVYGTEGTLELPDPNGFGGQPRIWTSDGRWFDVAIDVPGARPVERGIGLIDMGVALDTDRPHRASAELALHVLEIMDVIGRASETGEHQLISTTCRRPEPFDLQPGVGADRS